MDDLISLVKLKRENLAVNDQNILRDEVAKLEDQCRTTFPDLDQEELNRKLWMHLVGLSIYLRNVELSIIAISKLKLTQLLSFVRSILIQKTLNKENNDVLALFYVSSYFNIDTPSEFSQRLAVDDVTWSPVEHNRFLTILINSGKWSDAIDYINSLPIKQQQGDLRKSIIYHKLALHAELEENYLESNVNFKRSEVEERNYIRLLFKEHTNLAFTEVRNYCRLAGSSSESFWYNFLIKTGLYFEKENEKHQLHNHQTFLISGFKRFEKNILVELPEKISLFIKDNSSSKWLNKRQVDYTFSFGASLNPSTRGMLAELALRYRETNMTLKACNIYLCLDQPIALIGSLPDLLDRASSLNLVCQHGKPNQLADSLVNYARNTRNHSEGRGARKSKEDSILFISYLKMGLIDEAVNVIATGSSEDESTLSEGIAHLENAVEKRFTASLSDIDPEITRTTLNNVLKMKKLQVSLTPVITIVILAIIIFLNKLQDGATVEVERYMLKLEIMFELVSGCLVSSNFTASDTIVRSVNILVEAVKDKLDLLSDCDSIRESFRRIVEATADRCMIEGRYKNAALLYNHIEDHKSAVKSLMRMGDLEVVINYSLLVRDIAVNRITINYLKHLNVDLAVIKDFIARSQT